MHCACTTQLKGSDVGRLLCCLQCAGGLLAGLCAGRAVCCVCARVDSERENETHAVQRCVCPTTAVCPFIRSLIIGPYLTCM